MINSMIVSTVGSITSMESSVNGSVRNKWYQSTHVRSRTLVTTQMTSVGTHGPRIEDLETAVGGLQNQMTEMKEWMVQISQQLTDLGASTSVNNVQMTTNALPRSSGKPSVAELSEGLTEMKERMTQLLQQSSNCGKFFLQSPLVSAPNVCGELDEMDELLIDIHKLFDEKPECDMKQMNKDSFPEHPIGDPSSVCLLPFHTTKKLNAFDSVSFGYMILSELFFLDDSGRKIINASNPVASSITILTTMEAILSTFCCSSTMVFDRGKITRKGRINMLNCRNPMCLMNVLPDLIVYSNFFKNKMKQEKFRGFKFGYYSYPTIFYGGKENVLMVINGMVCHKETDYLKKIWWIIKNKQFVFDRGKLKDDELTTSGTINNQIMAILDQVEWLWKNEGVGIRSVSSNFDTNPLANGKFSSDKRAPELWEYQFAIVLHEMNELLLCLIYLTPWDVHNIMCQCLYEIISEGKLVKNLGIVMYLMPIVKAKLLLTAWELGSFELWATISSKDQKKHPRLAYQNSLSYHSSAVNTLRLFSFRRAACIWC